MHLTPTSKEATSQFSHLEEGNPVVIAQASRTSSVSPNGQDGSDRPG